MAWPFHDSGVSGAVDDVKTKSPWVDSRAYDSLALAEAAAYAAGLALRIYTTHTLAASQSIRVPWSVEPGGMIALGGQTLTVSYDPPLECRYQIFSGTGTVSGLSTARPEWWGGAPGTAGATDCTTPIRTAMNSARRVLFTDMGSTFYYKTSLAMWLRSNARLEADRGGRPWIYNDTATAQEIFVCYPAWRAAIAYQVGDTVDYGGTAYICLVAHTAGVWATDLAAAKWTTTGASDVEDVEVRGLKIQNGICTAGDPTAGKDGITTAHIKKLKIIDCEFPQCGGNYVIKHEYSDGVEILWSRFPKWTYAAVATLVESKNTLIQWNRFGTPTSLTKPQQYAVMSGSETTSEGTFGTRGWRVLDNYFEFDNSISTSNWFAIVSHGGEKLWIERNFILNYRAGIQMAKSSAYWSSPVLKNVWVLDNTVDRGTATTAATAVIAAGIQVRGLNWELDGNWYVDRNYVKGMGQELTPGSLSGAYDLGYGTHVRFFDNVAENYEAYGLILVADLVDCKVLRNRFTDYVGGVTGYGIWAASAGLYGVEIDYNEIDYTDVTYAPAVGIHGSVSYPGNIIVGEHNQIMRCGTTQVSAYLNWAYDNSALPSSKYWKPGDPVFGTWPRGKKLLTAGAPGSYGGYYGHEGAAATASGTSGEDHVHLDNTALYKQFPAGSWVVVTNGAAGPANLTTQVLKSGSVNYGSTTIGTLTLRDALGADVAAQAVEMVHPNFRGPCLAASGVAASTSGTGEDSLLSFTVPGYTLGVYDTLMVFVAGTMTGTAGNKTVKIKWGTTTLTALPADSAASDWSIELRINVGVASNAQGYNVKGVKATAIVALDTGTSAQNVVNNLVIAVTGECANAGDTITMQAYTINILS